MCLFCEIRGQEHSRIFATDNTESSVGSQTDEMVIRRKDESMFARFSHRPAPSHLRISCCSDQRLDEDLGSEVLTVDLNQLRCKGSIVGLAVGDAVG